MRKMMIYLKMIRRFNSEATFQKLGCLEMLRSGEAKSLMCLFYSLFHIKKLKRSMVKECYLGSHSSDFKRCFSISVYRDIHFNYGPSKWSTSKLESIFCVCGPIKIEGLS